MTRGTRPLAPVAMPDGIGAAAAAQALLAENPRRHFAGAALLTLVPD